MTKYETREHVIDAELANGNLDAWKQALGFPRNDNMDLPRQPQPVIVTFEGDPRDIEVYLAKIQAAVERNSYDNAVRAGSNRLHIYPRAVND